MTSRFRFLPDILASDLLERRGRMIALADQLSSRKGFLEEESVYLLCLIFSGAGLGVAVGDGDWNCQETRLLCDIPLSDIQ